MPWRQRGGALASVEKAHGYNKFWLWPLHHKENIDAGCQQCHAKEIVTEMADTLNQGREIFRLRGCMACHRYEGFDREADEISSVNQQIRTLEQQKAEWKREAGFAEQKANNPRTSDDEAKKLLAHSNDLKVRASGLDATIEQLDMRSRSLVREVKKVGPSLKEARVKLKKEWIPVWLKDPHQWREGTKMPSFRLDDGEIRAISAFLWQAGVKADLPQQKPGDAARGKEAFETRGCMACHSMGEGAGKQGGTFAANLSREGEKANYDYLVRWVHNPRQRSAPYCTFEKKDITAADYERKGLPYVFDLEHSKCPNDGHELQVQQMTPMPSLRLTEDEARDVASYLLTRKHDNASYQNADYMDDPNLKNQGLALVRNYGCAGCHEIAGLEEEQRIGTELTKEGSKPIERLDFALLGHKAEAEDWYTHKGFFEHKLENPAVYDTGKEKAKQDRLKMPNFNFSKPEIDAVTTFLEGSVDASVPSRYFYSPTDARQDIIDGWWVIRKYNCMGCHKVHVGQNSDDRRHGEVSGSGLEGSTAAHADRRRRARQSGVADAVPQQSGAQRVGHESRRSTAVSQDQNAYLQLLRWRAPQDRALLRGALVAGAAVHSREAGAADRGRAHDGAESFHQRRRTLPEVPHDGRREARFPRDGSQLHGSQGAAEAGLDQAVDAGPGADESGDGHAERPVPHG